jgi:uncharacterized membrane protein
MLINVRVFRRYLEGQHGLRNRWTASFLSYSHQVWVRRIQRTSNVRQEEIMGSLAFHGAHMAIIMIGMLIALIAGAIAWLRGR